MNEPMLSWKRQYPWIAMYIEALEARVNVLVERVERLERQDVAPKRRPGRPRKTVNNAQT